MKKYVSTIFIVVAGLITLSCQGEKKAATLDIGSNLPPGGSTTIVSEVPNVPAASYLYFKLGVKWETDSAINGYDFVKTCSIPATAPLNTEVTCEISVQEERLYFSKLLFKVGTLNNSTCSIVKFYPYGYTRSISNIQFDWNSSPTTCSTERTPECYGGAAPVMIGANYPKKQTGFYFLPPTGNEGNYPLESENITRHYGGEMVNFLVTNDIGNPATTNTSTGAFRKETASWQDYEIQCNDIWGETLYRMIIKISDENTVSQHNGTTVELDNYTDWPY